MTIAAALPLRLRLHPSPTRVGARLMAFGAAQPKTTVSSAELGAPFGKSAQWIEERTGIRELRRLQPGEPLMDLAAAAGCQAIERSGLAPAEIDLVLSASCSGTNLSTGLTQRLAPRAAGFDINAVCAGFPYAVSTADAAIRNGSARHVLIVAAEKMSGLIDPADLGTSILFGDGAGAAVLGPAQGGSPGIHPVVWGSDGEQHAMIACDDQFMRMQGQGVFRWAVDSMHRIAREAVAAAGFAIKDIAVFVPHQANLRIIDALSRKLGLEGAVVADDVTCSGNTSAASIPIAMARLIERGLVGKGQLALLLGFGAGLSYAGQVVVIP